MERVMTVSGSRKHLEVNNKVDRPDGTDVGRYRNLNKWSYRKWAWEFLRRNTSFIAECKRVRNGTEADRQAVADQYGLKKFKMYSENYRGASGMPRFSMGSISSWTNLDCDNAEDRRIGIRLGYGQVLVRFNLPPIIQDIKALDKQLRLVELRIKKRLAKYEKIIEKESALHKHKAMNFGIYIRLLDLLNAGKTPQECAELVFSSRKEIGGRGKYLHHIVNEPIESAMRMADEGYLYLSVLKEMPKGKGI